MINVTPTTEHPVPFDLSDEQPKTHADSVAIAANTADLIAQLGGSIEYNNEDLEAAKKLILGETKPEKPKTVAISAQAQATSVLIKQFDFNAFQDQLQARNFITNRLIEIASCGDTKHELKALELLGKHSDIGLFSERSEIHVHHTTSTTLENSIKERVKRLLNAEVIDITPLDDLDLQLGPEEPFQPFQSEQNEQPEAHNGE
jgi:hypothetical protein